MLLVVFELVQNAGYSQGGIIRCMALVREETTKQASLAASKTTHISSSASSAHLLVFLCCLQLHICRTPRH